MFFPLYSDHIEIAAANVLFQSGTYGDTTIPEPIDFNYIYQTILRKAQLRVKLDEYVAFLSVFYDDFNPMHMDSTQKNGLVLSFVHPSI